MEMLGMTDTDAIDYLEGGNHRVIGFDTDGTLICEDGEIGRYNCGETLEMYDPSNLFFKEIETLLNDPNASVEDKARLVAAKREYLSKNGIATDEEGIPLDPQP